MTDFEIRRARESDQGEILTLIMNYQKWDVKFAKRYYDSFFKKAKVTKYDDVYVALLDSQIAGVIGYCFDYFSTDHVLWLGWFVVDEEYRGNRIGSNLLRKVEESLIKKGRKGLKLFVSTESENYRALKFYQKNGFRLEGCLKDYYGENEDQLILAKILILK
ncbi:GNAT family N-acetyltransferase [Thermodesulfobacteriota bacterium]